MLYDGADIVFDLKWFIKLPFVYKNCLLIKYTTPYALRHSISKMLFTKVHSGLVARQYMTFALTAMRVLGCHAANSSTLSQQMFILTTIGTSTYPIFTMAVHSARILLICYPAIEISSRKYANQE